MAPHSSALAWKIPWTEEPVHCSPWGCEESDATERLHFHFSHSCIGKDSDAGRDWGQEEKGMTQDEMAGWHHQLDEHGFG